MVLDWGMGERFKHISLGEDQGNVFLGEELAKGREYSDETAREVDEEIRRITENAYERAVETLREHREAFDNLADMLVEREEVPGNDVLRLVNGEAEDLDQLPATNGEMAAEGDGASEDVDPSGAEVLEEDSTPSEDRSSDSGESS